MAKNKRTIVVVVIVIIALFAVGGLLFLKKMAAEKRDDVLQEAHLMRSVIEEDYIEDEYEAEPAADMADYGGAALSQGLLAESNAMDPRMAEQVKLDENEFSAYQPHVFKNVLNSPFSTFGADVDTASYTILRYYLKNRDSVPYNQKLRAEEMLNYFRYDYPSPNEGEPFAITTELVQTPWNKDTQLLLIGMQAPKLKEIPKSNIVFLIDISGSMDENDKLPLLKDSIMAALPSFTENDRISIVTYASGEKLVLSGANPAKEKNRIKDAIESLEADGSTNGERGLEMAYEVSSSSTAKTNSNGYSFACSPIHAWMTSRR